MRIPRVSSVPTGLIVADFFVHTSVHATKLCRRTPVGTNTNTKGKRKKGKRESEVAHKWAGWLHNPCRPGGPQCFRAGYKIRSGPQVGRVVT